MNMHRYGAPFDPSRRKFLGTCCAAVGATGLLASLSQLRLLGAIAAPGSDYRALVCLFLAGGNDANNLVVPTDSTGYGAYSSGRGFLALPQASLLQLGSGAAGDGHTYGLHPAMSGLHDLFNSGQAALLANVGTLCAPTTKAQYTARSVTLPYQLFSHNDQQVEWQSSLPDRPFTTGWGGRLADLTNAFNENPRISMAISLNGQNSFQVGGSVVQYAVNPTGAVSLSGSSSVAGSLAGIRTEALSDLLAAQQPALFETAFADATSNALDASVLLADLLAGDPPYQTAFPNSNLGRQLAMISRLIAVAPQLGLKRQIFFARVGGWDLHDQQVAAGAAATGAHATLLSDVSSCLAAFHAANVELGVGGQVTTFTASDFGRTFNTNGDGSDHGWGSHHLIVGGAVRGGRIYGRMPDWTINGPDDTGRGRWIPSTSVDEYCATLATWFGVSSTDLPTVLPNIGRFGSPNLGFLG